MKYKFLIVYREIKYFKGVVREYRPIGEFESSKELLNVFGSKSILKPLYGFKIKPK